MYSGVGGGSVVWLLTCSWISHLFYFHTFVIPILIFIWFLFLCTPSYAMGYFWLYTQELLLGGLRRNARKGTWVDCIQGPSTVLSFLLPIRTLKRSWFWFKSLLFKHQYCTYNNETYFSRQLRNIWFWSILI